MNKTSKKNSYLSICAQNELYPKPDNLPGHFKSNWKLHETSLDFITPLNNSTLETRFKEICMSSVTLPQNLNAAILEKVFWTRIPDYDQPEMYRTVLNLYYKNVELMSLVTDQVEARMQELQIDTSLCAAATIVGQKHLTLKSESMVRFLDFEGDKYNAEIRVKIDVIINEPTKLV